MNSLVKIIYKNQLIAFIIKVNFRKKGSHFFTSHEFPQQLAYMHWPKGHIINSHLHPPVEKRIRATQEVILVKSGRLRIDFYNNRGSYIESRILDKGDLVFIACGGHGFEFLKKGEIIEIKQGPFSEDNPSVKFEAVIKDKVKLKK